MKWWEPALLFIIKLRIESWFFIPLILQEVYKPFPPLPSFWMYLTRSFLHCPPVNASLCVCTYINLYACAHQSYWLVTVSLLRLAIHSFEKDKVCNVSHLSRPSQQIQRLQIHNFRRRKVELSNYFLNYLDFIVFPFGGKLCFRKHFSGVWLGDS